MTSSANETAIETAIKQLAKVPQVAQVTNPILTKSVSPDGKVALATLLWNTPAANVQNSSLSDMQTAAAPADAGRTAGRLRRRGLPGLEPEGDGDAGGHRDHHRVLHPADHVRFAVIAGLLPILSALIGVAITVTGITALAAVFSIATVSTTVAIMLGLSTGIDYGVFILSRHRSQLLAGSRWRNRSPPRSARAGSAVVFAGATVIVALCGLSVVGIPFLRTMGLVAAGAVPSRC